MKVKVIVQALVSNHYSCVAVLHAKVSSKDTLKRYPLKVPSKDTL